MGLFIIQGSCKCHYIPYRQGAQEDHLDSASTCLIAFHVGEEARVKPPGQRKRPHRPSTQPLSLVS